MVAVVGTLVHEVVEHGGRQCQAAAVLAHGVGGHLVPQVPPGYSSPLSDSVAWSRSGRTESRKVQDPPGRSAVLDDVARHLDHGRLEEHQVAGVEVGMLLPDAFEQVVEQAEGLGDRQALEEVVTSHGTRPPPWRGRAGRDPGWSGGARS